MASFLEISGFILTLIGTICALIPLLNSSFPDTWLAKRLEPKPRNIEKQILDRLEEIRDAIRETGQVQPMMILHNGQSNLQDTATSTAVSEPHS